MQAISLLALRISIGLLLVIWGIDKIVDLEHAVAVSNKVYYGLFSGPLMQSLLTVVGALEISLGIAVIAGVFRHIAYIFLALVTGTTLVAVSGSVIDPWGMVSRKFKCFVLSFIDHLRWSVSVICVPRSGYLLN